MNIVFSLEIATVHTKWAVKKSVDKPRLVILYFYSPLSVLYYTLQCDQLLNKMILEGVGQQLSS